MKSSFQILVLLALLAITAFSCQSEEKFITQEEGLWSIVSRTTRVYENDVLTSDVTKTDSLGQIQFVRGGSGTQFDYAGVKTDFTWVLNKKEDRITVYYPVGPFMDAAITTKGDNEMTFDWTIEQGTGQPLVVRTENTMKIERL